MCASASIVLHIKYIFSIIRRFKQIKQLYNQKRQRVEEDVSQESQEPVKESELLVSNDDMVVMGFRNNHIKRSRRRMTSTYMERKSSSSIRFNRRRKSRRLEMRVGASTVTDSLSYFQASAL